MKMSLFLFLFISLSASRALAWQDEDEVADRLRRGRIALENNCLICHSSELIASQRLTRDQWAAELTKMVGWGAPLQDEEKSFLLPYLLENYSSHSQAMAVPRLGATEAGNSDRAEPPLEQKTAFDRVQGEKLFATLCAGCHGTDAKGGPVGNNLVRKPILVRPGEYREVVRQGRHKMPAFQTAIGDVQENDLLGWLRSLGGT